MDKKFDRQNIDFSTFFDLCSGDLATDYENSGNKSTFKNPDDFFKDDNTGKNNLLNYLIERFPGKPVIKILDEIRNGFDRIVHDNIYDTFLKLEENECAFMISEQTAFEKDGSTIKMKLNHTGDTIDAFTCTNLDSVKRVVVYIDNCEAYSSKNFKISKYFRAKDNTPIDAIPLSSYSFPILSTPFKDIYLEIEFENYEIVDKEDLKIELIYSFIGPRIDRLMLMGSTFELDMQEESFFLFGHGTIVQHFCGDFSPALKDIMKLAHKESERRRNI